jgi:outer membrane murein-binding lipoprotein Lpp
MTACKGKTAMKLYVLAGLSALALLAGCAPTIKVEVSPINIYAKLDADVRVRLDKEVQTLIAANPNLF